MIVKIPLFVVLTTIVVTQAPQQREAAPPPRRLLEVAPSPRSVEPRVEVPQAVRRHALILCGHPGDAEHAKSFQETVLKLGEGLTNSLGIPAERQRIVFGSDAPKDLPNAIGPATRETVAKEVAEIIKSVKPEDGLWVICLGHAHHDGRQAWWNLPGPDLNALEFGRLFAELNCREQVFVMTSSLSGYFVAPLAKKNRVVIAATEADSETNETNFPASFAEILASGFKLDEHDVDEDKRLTLFDLYVITAKVIAQDYASNERVATEHSQLDDDGDGVGHEIQNAYLPEAQGGTPPGKKPSRKTHRDGVRAAQILLSIGK
jgi:hypothetical protein